MPLTGGYRKLGVQSGICYVLAEGLPRCALDRCPRYLDLDRILLQFLEAHERVPRALCGLTGQEVHDSAVCLPAAGEIARVHDRQLSAEELAAVGVEVSDEQ
jgi:hypothetical protein